MAGHNPPAHGIDPGNVRVIKVAKQGGLIIKATPYTGGRFRSHQLDRHSPWRRMLTGFIDLPHATTADQPQNCDAPQVGSGRQRFA